MLQLGPSKVGGHVGLGDGTTDGLDDGLAVGVADGAAEGVPLGRTEGIVLGFSVNRHIPGRLASTLHEGLLVQENQPLLPASRDNVTQWYGSVQSCPVSEHVLMVQSVLASHRRSTSPGRVLLQVPEPVVAPGQPAAVGHSELQQSMLNLTENSHRLEHSLERKKKGSTTDERGYDIYKIDTHYIFTSGGRRRYQMQINIE